MGSSVQGGYRGRPTGKIWIYDVRTGKNVRIIEEAHADTVRHLAFADGDKQVISVADQYVRTRRNEVTEQPELLRDGDPVRIWDIATGAKIASFTIASGGAKSLAVGLNGQLIILGAGTAIRGIPSEYIIWDKQSGTQIANIEGSAYGAAFSPDGCCVATTDSGWRQIIVRTINTTASKQ
jgi:WD40 repeat protein